MLFAGCGTTPDSVEWRVKPQSNYYARDKAAVFESLVGVLEQQGDQITRSAAAAGEIDAQVKLLESRVRGAARQYFVSVKMRAIGDGETGVELLVHEAREGDFKVGDWKFMAGYAFCSGQDNSGDYTIGNAYYGGIGDDWDLLLVGMDKPGIINGHAKTDGTGETIGLSGVKLAYLDIAWKASKTLKFWATYGHMTADTVDMFPAGTDDKIGQEFDVNFSWKIAKNLAWLWRFGYWDTGDFWKGAEGITNLDDTFTVFHKLALKF